MRRSRTLSQVLKSASQFSFCKGGGDFARGLRGNNFNVYAQDTFKISSRFTLNYGLRYEIPFPYTEIKIA